MIGELRKKIVKNQGFTDRTKFVRLMTETWLRLSKLDIKNNTLDSRSKERASVGKLRKVHFFNTDEVRREIESEGPTL